MTQTDAKTAGQATRTSDLRPTTDAPAIAGTIIDDASARPGGVCHGPPGLRSRG